MCVFYFTQPYCFILTWLDRECPEVVDILQCHGFESQCSWRLEVLKAMLRYCIYKAILSVSNDTHNKNTKKCRTCA